MTSFAGIYLRLMIFMPNEERQREKTAAQPWQTIKLNFCEPFLLEKKYK
jgi:hypothetical protein